MKVVGCFLRQNRYFSAFLVVLLAIISVQQLPAQEQKNAPLSLTSESSATEDNDSIIVNTHLISFNVSVTDIDGFAVTGLDKNVFSIFDNKIPQEIHFFSDADAPASISVVLDSSGSMSGKKINQAKQALANFIQTTKEQDEFFLIDVGSKANLLLNATRDGDALLEKFNFAQPKGNTALYDAVNLGVEKVSQGSFAKKIVLIISDGEDNNSRFSFKKLKNSVKESNAIIYAIGIGGFLPSFSKGMSGRDVLIELASESGGKAFFPNSPDEMNDAFERIALEIRHLYSIGYYPSEVAVDGKNHRITVKVKSSNESRRWFVKSRKEYKSQAISIKR